MTSASQWKRCFTNPDSWMKWNIFRALFLGLGLAGSPQPHIQGHPTPHLSVTHGEQGKPGFSCRNVVASWACHVGQRKSQTLPESGISPGTSSSCSLSHGNSPCLWFWRKSNKSFPKSRRHQKRPLKGQSGSHSAPRALAHPGLGSAPLWQGNSTPSFFPVQKKVWE